MNVTAFRLVPVVCAALMALHLPAAADSTDLLAPMFLAQSNGANGARPRGGPPPEAFEACQSKAVSERCEVALKGRSALEGTCQQPPRGRDSALVCVPAGAAPKG